MAGGTINPYHPPNAPQALIPYPALNQPVLFVIGDQFNQQSPYLSYPANPPAYYPQSGHLPPGNVSQQPRAAQQSYGYRQTPPYPSFPMQSTPRESSGASRMARSSALRIVDVRTNRDVLTGEEVPPSTVVNPTTATPPEIVATGFVSAAEKVEESSKVTAPFFSEAKEIAPTPLKNTNVALIKEVKAEGKPTVVTSPTPSVPAAVTARVGETPIIAEQKVTKNK